MGGTKYGDKAKILRDIFKNDLPKLFLTRKTGFGISINGFAASAVAPEARLVGGVFSL